MVQYTQQYITSCLFEDRQRKGDEYIRHRACQLVQAVARQFVPVVPVTTTTLLNTSLQQVAYIQIHIRKALNIYRMLWRHKR